MRAIWSAVAAATMLSSLVTASPLRAQSSEDLANLDNCRGYEACKKVQDRIDAIKAAAANLADKVSGALTPKDDRGYFEKFSLEERLEVVAQCAKTSNTPDCEARYLSPAEFAARHPQKPAPPADPEADRRWDKQQLEKFDRDVAGTLDVKCFTPEMANGLNYGDCAAALTQLNLIEKDARAAGVTLRSSTLAAQFGFYRKADGTWDDRYTRVGAPAQQTAQMQPEVIGNVPPIRTKTDRPSIATDSAETAYEANAAALIPGLSSNALYIVARCQGYIQHVLNETVEKRGFSRDRAIAEIRAGIESSALLSAEQANALNEAQKAVNSLGVTPNNIGYFNACLYQTRLAQLGPIPSPAPPASGGVSLTASGLTGEWVGQNSGNRVKIVVQSGGVLVTPVTNNAGQASDGYLYRNAGQGSYRFKFPDGNDSVIQELGPTQLRVTNPDGWTDVFSRAGTAGASAG